MTHNLSNLLYLTTDKSRKTNQHAEERVLKELKYKLKKMFI